MPEMTVFRRARYESIDRVIALSYFALALKAAMLKEYFRRRAALISLIQCHSLIYVPSDMFSMVRHLANNHAAKATAEIVMPSALKPFRMTPLFIDYRGERIAA